MKIILSPAKKMKMEQEAETLTTPVFMENTKELMCWMQKLTYEKAKKLWYFPKCTNRLVKKGCAFGHYSYALVHSFH